MRDEPNIILVGRRYIPTSSECNGCHNFNYLCEGSVYRGECPTGQVENIAPSIVAMLLDHHINNRFILARVFGYKDEVMKIEKAILDEELQIDLEAAKALTDEEIQEIKEKYLVEQYQYTRIFD